MAFASSIPADRFGYDFIPPEFLPPGKDEYWLRNTQISQSKDWRNIKSSELEILIGNSNSCSNWDNFLVSDPFDPTLIRNSAFYGLVRIGSLRKVLVQFHDFYIPTGIRNSTIISCDIGDDTSIQDCSYISHYIIGDNCILFQIDEMQTTNHARFGCGALKDGEKEEWRTWIDVMNEAGGRSILPFPKMLTADAYLWAAYRDDTGLTEALKNITQKEYGGYRGSYGVIGSHTVIKSSMVIKDAYIGEWAYIKGANKLKNVSVFSSKDEPSQIGEGVEMVNGIMGYGSNAFYGIKAVRFVMGRFSSLKYGARLIHSVLGDNSTVSCCEILNNLIFPVHEQHHNNSFLIASLVGGMSNMAAGATIGSNHNSRSNDGEIRAGRGFWPGLSSTLKHSSLFASFILIAKGDYQYELNIKLPFSLVSNNTSLDRLEIMPAYFWMYNMYALERNSWKAIARDKRKIKKQRIEADYLAPDTVEEIITALMLMEEWMKEAGISYEEAYAAGNFPPLSSLPKEDNPISARGMEKNSRPEVLLKPLHAMAAYRQMLLYYSLKTIANYLEENETLSYNEFTGKMENGTARVSEWVNLGGQIVPASRVDMLREKIRSSEINSWNGIHSSYDDMAAEYPLDRARHAWEVYRYLKGNAAEHPLKKAENFKEELNTLVLINRFIAEQVYKSRVKDYDDPFRSMTYRNTEELNMILGNVENNSFIKLVNERVKTTEESAKKLRERLL